VLEVMDGHRRDDGVKAPERGQRFSQVVADELDPLVPGEALACRREHQLGEVNADTAHVAAVVLQQGEQAAVAGAEVEDARGFASDLLEQHALSLGAARMLLCPAAVAIDVRGGLPFRHESEYAPTAPG